MSKSESTPINVQNIQDSFNHIKVKTLTRSAFKLKISRDNLILAISFIVFLAGIGFWGYVNFYLASGG